MKKYLIFGLLMAMLLSVGIVTAAKSDLAKQVVEINPSAGQAIVAIPAHAVEVTPGVFSLGTSQDIDGKIVEGFLFVDNKKGYAKPPWAGKGKGGGEKCYALFAKGAKWKITEKYITGNGIDTTLTETSLNTWDTEVSFDVFGTRDTTGTTDGADSESPDGKNEVEFANLGATNTIAYAIVWGIFYGPPGGRELVEWDVVFNSDYAWSLNGEEEKMDYQNIASHEFGHAAGLAHPDDSCTEETMYKYAELGETKKQDLNTGDIAGIQELYGN